ncbi:MAG TPA: nucleotidyltransferase family protein [Azospirillaceae bacterium]|nr:nucleotidyltransferase family protein [Azospirillaceae bacterium]
MPIRTLDRLAPEFRLLCRAARQSPPEDTTVAAVIDWAAVVAGARRHRAVGLVYPGLRAGGLDVPSDVVASLAASTRANGLRALAQAAEIARLSHLFAEAGIRVIVLKGVVLSQQLYGNPAMRGVGDIDLLVDPARFWDADAVLAAAGYRARGAPLSEGRRTTGQHLLRDVTYRHATGQHLVEMHQRLFHNPSRLKVDFVALWRDRIEVGLGGTAIATLPRRVLPVYLCIHGAHHGWERLCWLADLAALLRDDDNIAIALAEAEAAGVAGAMRLAVALSHDWLGLPLPETFVLDRREARHVERFVAHFFAGDGWLTEWPRGSVGWLRREFRRRFYVYSLKKTWRHRWQEFQADILNPIDWDVFSLPDRLLWLYPLLRPVGWVLRNTRRWRSGG